MVTLEQVEQLEAKVQKVVAIVEELRQDNERLRLEKKQIESDFVVLRERYEATTSKAGALESAQSMVEKGIMEAIDMLDEASRSYENTPVVAEESAQEQPYISPMNDDASGDDTHHA
jgi:predicted nuclease with TOPRIM domain